MWRRQAARSCKGRAFAVAKLSRRLENSKLPNLMVAEVTGYAVCSGSGLSEEQVRKAIEDYERGHHSERRRKSS